MKLHPNLTRTAQADLQTILSHEVLSALKQRFAYEVLKSSKQTELNDMGTPSTVDTALRKRGSAITKSKRPQSRSSNKAAFSLFGLGTNSSLTTGKFQTTVASSYEKQQQGTQEEQKEEKSSVAVGLSRRVLIDRAVYYGNVELPYLHSSDAISCLYEKSKADKGSPEALINPPPNISAHLLTNLKSLYLYYTPIDSLRQLGTGWSNLKSLTVMCSAELRDLSGLSIFPSLQYLFVPHNSISEISDIMYHASLRCLDLEDNMIDLMEQVQYTYTIGNLEWVDIAGNPITNQKQKYRIICENLGNKLQMEGNNKLFQFQLREASLLQELLSYQNIQVSNSLIKDINEQILKQEIKVGRFWRAAQSPSQMQHQPYEQPDIQIFQSYQQESHLSQVQEPSPTQPTLQLRVTSLAQYIKPGISIIPLQKYFNNKVCPPTKFLNQQQKKEKERDRERGREKQAQSRQQISLQQKNKKFSATQTLKPCMSIDEKPRLNSVSLKKRLGKLSVSKLSTPSSSLGLSGSLLKHKDEYINDINPITPGLKFLAKKRFLAKPSSEVLANN